jgi:(p)ppGpp synthase/HD superfamily hydrolase
MSSPTPFPSTGGLPISREQLSEVETAEAVARAAHFGQKDKLGRDYFDFHVRPVAERVAQAGARGSSIHAAALLHDVLEDCPDYSDGTLRVAGISEETIEIVVALTRGPDETYDDYIERVSANRKARVVKLADNLVNSENLPLLAEVDPATADRLRRRYERARETLLDAEGTDPT